MKILTFENYSQKIAVKKDDILYGYIELTADEKSFQSYGSKKFLHAEIVEIKQYLDNNNFSG